MTEQPSDSDAAGLQAGPRRRRIDASLIVAVAAMALSFFTSVVQIVHTDRQDRTANLREMRNAINELAALYVRHVEYGLKYRPIGDQRKTGRDNSYREDVYRQEGTQQIDSALSFETRTLAEEANTLANSLGNRVTAWDLSGVAAGLMQIHQLPLAAHLYRQAVARARSADEYTTALDGLAWIAGLEGRKSAADADYARAARALDRFPDKARDASYSAYQMATIYMGWARSDAAFGDCVAAGQHLDQARRYIASLPDDAGLKQILIPGVQELVSMQRLCGGPAGSLTMFGYRDSPLSPLPESGFPRTVPPMRPH